MTPLSEKRVVPTPKYALRRWLSATVAVFVFVCALWGVGQIARQEIPVEAPPVSSTTVETFTTTTAPLSTTTTVNDTTTLTTLAETFTTSMESAATSTTQTTTSMTQTTTYPNPTYATIPTAPKITTGTTASRTTTASTTAPTTTKKTTTTTTTTRPYWEDAIPAAVTEDGLPIEEVRWIYEPITYDSLQLPRCYDDHPDSSYSAITVSETPSGVPLNQCIKVTGCVGTTSNGIYRVPATIDGKVVACVNFNDSFADSEVALSVKRIYLPPDTIAFYGGIQQCTNLEALYFTAPKTWFYHKTLPLQIPSWYGGVKQYDLTIYTPGFFYPTFVWNLTPPVFMYACNGNIYDAEAALITNEQCQALYGNPK